MGTEDAEMTEPSRPPKPDELRGLATALDTLGYNEKAKPTLIAALRAAADCISEAMGTPANCGGLLPTYLSTATACFVPFRRRARSTTNRSP
jgi:hypothetical protein